MAADQQQPDFWASLGAGLQNAGAILSPDSYHQQAEERKSALVNVARGLEIKKAQRALDADLKFSESLGGMQPSSFRTSGDILEALKSVPLDIIAESPRAQTALKMASGMQAKEAKQAQQTEMMEFRYSQLESQAEAARQRSEDARLSAVERARANLAREQMQGQIIDLKRTIEQRKGVDPSAPPRDYAAEYQKLDPTAQTALDMQAWNYINKGFLPYRKGTGGGADRNDPIIQRSAGIARELGLSAQELSAKSADFKSNAQSLAFATKKLDSIQGVLESFHNNVETWDSIAKGEAPRLGGEKAKAMQSQLSAINFTGIKSIDELKLKIQQQVNDPTTAAYLTATMAVAMDYARIMQGPQSAASLTEGARHEAMRLISSGVNNDARKAIIGTLYSDTDGQVKGLKDQTDKIRSRLGMKASPGGDAPAPSAPKTAVAPADIPAAAQKSWGGYEPEKYDYRINPSTGKLQRSPKGG